MRRWVVLALIAVSGCGGDGSKSGGAVDPASLDACLAWSNGVCRLAFLCVDTPARDAVFLGRYGADTDACFNKLMARCQANQSGDVFGPSCGPGKVVNQAALQICQDDLDTLLCTDWTASQAGNCLGICGGSSGNPGTGGGMGGAAGGGGGGAGGGGGSGSVSNPADYCLTGGYLTCDRGVACDPSTGPVDGCRAFFELLCPGATCSSTFNQQAAASCIAALQTASCDVILNGPNPAVCDTVCP
jgi:hypothetical protein